MNNFTEKVGQGCYTSPKFNRDVCQATRTDLGEWRFYRHDIGGTGSYRRGATFLADKIMTLTGENKYLQSWRTKMTAQLGTAGFEQWMTNVADFGTNDHILYDYLIKGELTTDILWGVVSEFAEKNRLNNVVREAALEKAKKDVLSFRAFNQEHNIEVFSVEQMHIHPDRRSMYWGLSVKKRWSKRKGLGACKPEII
jgi:hypothetical protein